MTENLVKARSTILFIVALITATMLALWIERTSDRLDNDAAQRHAKRLASNPPSSENFGKGFLKQDTAPSVDSPAMASPGNGQQAQASTKTVQAQRPAVPSTPPPEMIEFSRDLPKPPSLRPLTAAEKAWARTAWTYFKNNIDPKTGLANAVDRYPAATLWDTSSYLLALISAARIQVISEKEFDTRMRKALASMAALPLVEQGLPNKSYDIRTLEMVDYTGKPVPGGIGWSAIDIGRMVVPLHILVWNHPRHARAARQILARWNWDPAVDQGMMYGAAAEGASVKIVQEGRLGYEQYAAKGFALLGLNVTEALNYRRHLAYTDVYGIRVPHDRRNPREFGAQNFVVSEPYMLAGLEFGLDGVTQEFAWRVFRAQEARYRQTGILTSVSEDHLDRPPYFAYNTVFSDGKIWNTVTETGEDAGAHRSLSVKTAFAWHALYRTDYTEKLMQRVAELYDQDKGWYAGWYEQDKQPNKAVTANTNAVILESLAYIAQGPLLRPSTGAQR